MKIDRHGQAKILSSDELERLFEVGLQTDCDRALFAICLYTACRIREGSTLLTKDVYVRKGIVLPEIIFRKGNTKGKLATRAIPVIEELRQVLLNYHPHGRSHFLFPGLKKGTHIHPDSASRVFRKACQRVGIVGASTHSFRRTALTRMSDAGIPLRVIQEVSGHRNLEQLQRYLEVHPDQVRGAVSALSGLNSGKTSHALTLLVD
ncbi:tyrosine-type recombinase/integrase [Roseofilum casamattae]|uniref:Site-specific integrase n=1 Tax=Roseofilum casamattae BLCC-M143 TaxID=3022442 RepID=A0ABT7C3V7_9CYAN|nr:site-specific integrase [Roseofilum casamattae]MDJ1185872.1 site-specific integrase [Roseofilum casamattae BLCC-M143]